jgi:hypothetical protein
MKIHGQDHDDRGIDFSSQETQGWGLHALPASFASAAKGKAKSIFLAWRHSTQLPGEIGGIKLAPTSGARTRPLDLKSQLKIEDPKPLEKRRLAV